MSEKLQHLWIVWGIYGVPREPQNFTTFHQLGPSHLLLVHVAGELIQWKWLPSRGLFGPLEFRGCQALGRFLNVRVFVCSFLIGWDCNNSWVMLQFSSLFGLVRCWCFFFKRFGEGQGGSRHQNGEKNKVQSMTPHYIRPDL